MIPIVEFMQGPALSESLSVLIGPQNRARHNYRKPRRFNWSGDFAISLISFLNQEEVPKRETFAC